MRAKGLGLTLRQLPPKLLKLELATSPMSAALVPPLGADAHEWGIHPSIVSALEANGISNFFPIQRRAIPLVLRGDSRVSGLHEDVCVSAPTGSGKTLVYAAATVQARIKRVIPRLRALVILPSRDLAIQVYDVYANLCRTLPLRLRLLAAIVQVLLMSSPWLAQQTYLFVLQAASWIICGTVSRYPPTDAHY